MKSICAVVFVVSIVSLLAGSPVARASNVLSWSQWASTSPPSGWSMGSGEFTGDGRTDIYVYHPSNGAVFVGRNTGSSFVWESWATVSPPSGWTFASGDFTGDGRTDLFAYYPGNGSLWVGRNTGSSFAWVQWGSVTPASGWSFVPGDFTHDGRLDVLAYYSGDGSLWVGANSGAATFTFSSPWFHVGPASGWSFVAGDFTRDGWLDIAGYHPSNGSVWIGRNVSGTGFSFTLSRLLSPASGWNLVSGDFAGDGWPDLAAYASSSGGIWIGRSVGSRFFFGYEPWSTVGPADGWIFAPGDFDGDGRLDLVGYQPSNGSVWMGRNLGQPLEGYVWPLSARPGQTLSFYASGVGNNTAVIQRYRSTNGSVTAIDMANVSFTPVVQPLGVDPWANGSGWSPSFSFTIPSGWPSGIYAARFRSADGGDSYATFVVRPAASAQSNVAVLANINTWLAYNDWGGKGKYDGAALTSFLRPNTNAAPVGEGFGNHHLARGELWILTWLQDHGYNPDVYTDLDFHNGAVTGYHHLIFGTHPEYWTTTMYTRLQAFISSGGAAMYLGGNGVYESGVYSSTQSQMTFRLGVEDGPREPAMLRRLGLPERNVLGVATEACGVAGTAYTVLEASHPIFTGTGVVNGNTFGASGFNTGGGSFNGMASAWETDTSNGFGASHMGCSASDGNIYGSVPPGLTVLAGGSGSEMTFYQASGGGSIFSVGSITFGGSLVVDPVMSQIITNVLNTY